MNLESIDRRAFLRGLTITSAGLLVPRKAYSFYSQNDDDYIAQCVSDRLKVKPGYYTVTRPITIEGSGSLIMSGSYVDIKHHGHLIIAANNNYNVTHCYFQGPAKP